MKYVVVEASIKKWKSVFCSVHPTVLINQIAKDVIQNIVSIRLFCENECLNELAMRRILVGYLADNLNNNVLERGLRVDVEDLDFAAADVEGLYSLLNLLTLSLVEDQLKTRDKEAIPFRQ